jgi:hypothetical protein
MESFAAYGGWQAAKRLRPRKKSKVTRLCFLEDADGQSKSRHLGFYFFDGPLEPAKGTAICRPPTSPFRQPATGQ